MAASRDGITRHQPAAARVSGGPRRPEKKSHFVDTWRCASVVNLRLSIGSPAVPSKKSHSGRLQQRRSVANLRLFDGSRPRVLVHTAHTREARVRMARVWLKEESRRPQGAAALPSVFIYAEPWRSWVTAGCARVRHGEGLRPLRHLLPATATLGRGSRGTRPRSDQPLCSRSSRYAPMDMMAIPVALTTAMSPSASSPVAGRLPWSCSCFGAWDFASVVPLAC